MSFISVLFSFSLRLGFKILIYQIGKKINVFPHILLLPTHISLKTLKIFFFGYSEDLKKI